MRNKGGGFATNIYGAMPEGGIQVISHQSLGTTNPSSLATHPCFQTSGFKVQGCGAAHKNIEAPRRFETSGFLVSHP